MMITKKALPRRTVLRGLGACLAMPLLDSMVPALTSSRVSAAEPVRRFSVVYAPNGMMMPSWTPQTDGTSFELTPILKPLEPFRQQMIVLTGLDAKQQERNGGPHSNAATRFLSGVPYMGTLNGADILAEVTMDQLVARELGKQTQFASLELSLDRGDLPGSCESNYACKYTNTISWRGPTTPLPTEYDPRAVFERIFGEASLSPEERLARIRRQRSVLDSITDRVAELTRGLAAGDRHRLGEYLDSVRDVERRIQMAEEQSGREVELIDKPDGVPADYEEHMKLMFDLQVLAYQCDRTRIITFMMGRELTTRTFPQIGVTEGFHPTSHHQGDAAKIAILAKVETYHVQLFTYYLQKLQATRDGDGSLLDHMMLLYGAGISDSNAHDNHNLPLLLFGGGSGRLKGGRHLRFAPGTPMTNLLVTLMDKLDVPIDRIGDSTGKLQIDPLPLA